MTRISAKPNAGRPNGRMTPQLEGFRWCDCCHRDVPGEAFEGSDAYCKVCVQKRTDSAGAGPVEPRRRRRGGGGPGGFPSSRPADAPPLAENQKWCGKCERDLPESAFCINRRNRDGKSNWCRECGNRHAKRRLRRLQYYKQMVGCADCGHKYTTRLEFDHVYSPKAFNLSDRAEVNRRTWEEVILEVAKCQVRCRTCHSVRHSKIPRKNRPVRLDRRKEPNAHIRPAARANP